MSAPPERVTGVMATYEPEGLSFLSRGAHLACVLMLCAAGIALSWNGLESASAYTINYREAGTTAAWRTVPGESTVGKTQFLVDGLVPRTWSHAFL